MINIKEFETKIETIVESEYLKGIETTKIFPKGRYFTNHGMEHVKMVKEKTLEACLSIHKYIKNNSFPKRKYKVNGKYNEKIVIAAALSHDVGMNGDGLKRKSVFSNEFIEKVKSKYTNEDIDNINLNIYNHYEYNKVAGMLALDGIKDIEKYNIEFSNQKMNDYDEVRKNHSLNSARFVLENREKYKKIGLDDKAIDEISCLCYVHSKSSSGLKDLTNKEEWNDVFDTLEGLSEYLSDASNKNISFNRDNFKSSFNMNRLITETIALRIGDVSRDSFIGNVSQSGEKITLSDDDVWIGDRETISDEDSKPIHQGEQNINRNRLIYNTERNELVHKIFMTNKNMYCKQIAKAIKEHIKELATCNNLIFAVEIIMNEKSTKLDNDAYIVFGDLTDNNPPNVTIEIKNEYLQWL